MKRDYYEVLGLPHGAGVEDVRNAYRRLAKQYHPDVNKDSDAADRFKEISEAYAVLSDDDKRRAYDRFGHAGLNPNAGDFGFGGFSDIFEEFFGGLGGRAANRRAPRRGADLRLDLELTFEDTVSGADREVEVTRHEACEHCRGSRAEPGTSPVRCGTCKGSGGVRQVRQSFLGSMVSVTTCPTCQGTGETISTPCGTCRGQGQIRVTRKRTINVPPGVDDGTNIRLSAEGEPGLFGGPHGNLYVTLHVRPHEYFRRHGDDVLLDLSVNVAQAALGGAIKVPTVDGDETLAIPTGIQPGRVFRLKGRGIPHLQRGGRGDQLVIVSVHIPTSLSNEQKKLFKQLADTLSPDVHRHDKGLLERLRDVVGS